MEQNPEVQLPAPLDEGLAWLVSQLGGSRQDSMFPIVVGTTFGVLLVRLIWFDLMDKVMSMLGHAAYLPIRTDAKDAEVSAALQRRVSRNEATRHKLSMFAVKSFTTFVQAVMMWTAMFLWVQNDSWGKSGTVTPFMWTSVRLVAIATTAVFVAELSIKPAPAVQWFHHLATITLSLFIIVDSPSMSPEFALFWGAVGGALECPVFISMFIFNLYPDNLLVRLRCVTFNLVFFSAWTLFFTPANLYFLYAHQAVMPEPAITAAIVSLIGTLPMQVYASWVYLGMRARFLQRLEAKPEKAA